MGKFKIFGLALLLVAAPALAGFGEKILISGKVGSSYDRDTVSIDTDKGSVKVPRKSLSAEDEKRLAPGNKISVEVAMVDVFKANKVKFRTIANFDTSGRPCGAGGAAGCGK